MNMYGKFTAALWVPVLVLAALMAGCTDSGTGIVSGPSMAVAPSFTNTTATFPLGKARSCSFLVSGYPSPKVRLSGSLPAGLSFDTTTGLLSGTAGNGTVGRYHLTLTASNGIAPDAVTDFTLFVSNSAIIICNSLNVDQSSALSNMGGKFNAAGISGWYTTGVPDSTCLYAQIWDIRYDSLLSRSDIAKYTSYLQCGGSLVLIGENTGFIARNNSLSSLVTSLGNDGITFVSASNTQQVLPPFTGPDTVSSVNFLAGAGTQDPGKASFVTKDANGVGMSFVFWPGTLPAAPAGRLFLICDINFMETSANAASQTFVQNIIVNL